MRRLLVYYHASLDGFSADAQGTMSFVHRPPARQIS